MPDDAVFWPPELNVGNILIRFMEPSY